jgi:hypothetical protein
MWNRKNIISFLLTFLIPFYLIRFKLIIPTTLYEIFVVLIFLVILFIKPQEIISLFKGLNKYIMVGVFLFLIGSVLGVIISPDKVVALGQLKGFIAIPILAAISLAVMSKENFKPAKLGLYLIASLIAIEAIIEWLLGFRTLDNRIVGIYRLDMSASPNYLALFMTPIAALLMHDIASNKLKDNWQVIRIISLVFMAIAIYMTKSRAAVAVLLVFFLYELYCYCRKIFNSKLINILTLMIVVLAIFVSAQVALPNLSASSNDGRISSSNNIRYEIWQVTLKEIIPKHWFVGVGLGNFQKVFSKTTLHRVNFDEYISPLAVTPHDLFLSTWVDVGLIGLIGLIAILYGAIISMKNNKYWLIGLLSIIALGLVDTTVYKNDLGALFWIVIFVGSYHPIKLRDIKK